MKRAIEVVARGTWPEAEASGAVTLDYEARHRRRIRLECGMGEAVLLDLERATAMRDGDGLKLETGGWVAVRAADEELVEIRADTALALQKIAWHLGNRHCPTEIQTDRIYIRHDHVLEHMLEGLSARLTKTSRPFDPEGGAYAGQHGHDQ
jgi:urease accessory protein